MATFFTWPDLPQQPQAPYLFFNTKLKPLLQNRLDGILIKSATAGHITLTADEAAYGTVKITGAPGASRNLTYPTGGTGPRVIWNTCGSTVTVKYASGATITVASGNVASLLLDGSDVIAQSGGADSTSLKFIGDWDSAVTYAMNNVVRHQETLMRSRVDGNLNNSPSSSTSWEPLGDKITIGTGAPNNANGIDGQLYERDNGGVYKKISGAWVLQFTCALVGAAPTAHAASHAAAGSDPLTLTAAQISNFDTQVRTSRLDQMAAPTGAVGMNSQRITGLADPTSAQDAVTKSYADALAQGLSAKTAVLVAYGTNITLSGAASAEGGVTPGNGKRVLVMGQTTTSQNGIYLVNNSGAWTRALDADSWNELVSAYVFVEQGSAADNGYTCTIDEGGTLGTTAVTWTQFSGAGQITAGNGLTKTGNTLDVNVDGSTIEIVTDTLQIKDGGVSDAKLGNRTADDTDSSTSNTGTLTALLGRLAYRIKHLYAATTLGDLVYGAASGVATRLAGNTTTTRKFFTQTGDGTNSAAPAWNTIAESDLPVPTFVTLTDGATITWTMTGKVTGNATVTLAGNRTLVFSGLVNGMSGVLRVKQDATGSRTLTLPTGSKVVGGSGGAITLTTTANATDFLSWVYDGTNIYWSYGLNFT